MSVHRSKKIELTMDEIRKLVNQIEDQDLAGLAKITRLSWFPGQILPEIAFTTISDKFDNHEVKTITRNIFTEYHKLLCAQYPEHTEEFLYWDWSH